MEELLGEFTFSDDGNTNKEEKREKIVFVSDDNEETVFKFVEDESVNLAGEPVVTKESRDICVKNLLG